MPIVRSHDRDSVIAKNADGTVQSRRATVINPGFEKPEDEKEVEQRKRDSLRGGTGLIDDIEVPDASDAQPWDDRFLPLRMREMYELVDDPSTDVPVGGPAEDIWAHRRLLPERLRQLLAEETPSSEWRIVTRDEQLGLEQPFVVDSEPTQETDVVSPTPSAGEGGGDGGSGNGSEGGGDGPTSGGSAPTRTPRVRSRFEEIVLSASLAMGGAIASLSALNHANMALDQPTMSNAGIIAMAAGAAAPFVARKAYSLVRRVKSSFANGSAGLPPEWDDFREKTGWRRRQCRRWAKAGFSPEEAAAWNDEFALREGVKPGSYPPGGDSAAVQAAKEFRDFFPGKKITPLQARPYIDAWMTPGDLKTWMTRYWNPAHDYDDSMDESQKIMHEQIREDFVDLMISAHRNMCLQHGYGHKNVDIAMREECERRGLAPLARRDQPPPRTSSRQRRPYTVQDAAFDGAMIGDALYR